MRVVVRTVMWLGVASTLVAGWSRPVRAASNRPIPARELEYQQQAYEQWWGTKLERHLEQLPAKGDVPEYRVPYSGHDYPDRGGGTVAAMRKYDAAFHRGRMIATEYERRDVANGRRSRFTDAELRGRPLRRFFAGFRRGPRTPGWYGHCNGWTAAAIRHAEPQHSVVRNGVTFTPADIKGLLAEIYMYNDTEFLGGEDAVIHPAVLHLTLTNWLGRGRHPVGIESAVGEVVVNYPIYAYRATVTRHSDREAEVEMIVTYAMNTHYEMIRSPRISKKMRFHYLLTLDAEGRITGGSYYGDSAGADMLWVPLKPVQGGEKGNERGNPHVDVKEVLSIWRESVSEDVRKKWWNIDPTEEDRIDEPTSDEPRDDDGAAGVESAADGTTVDSGDGDAVSE